MEIRNDVRDNFTLRTTVSRPVYLGFKPPSGDQDQIFITVRRFLVRWCGALSMTRGWVCRLKLLLVLASAIILGSQSLGTVSDSRLPHPVGPVPRIYISQEQGDPVVPPSANFLFVAFDDSQSYGGRVRTSLHAWRRGVWLLTGPGLNTSAVFSRCRGNNVSTELFRSNGCCTAACLHSCYLAMDLHVTVLFGRTYPFMRTYLELPVVYFLQHVSVPRFDYRHDGTATKDS
jgi:hypothetical protein